MAGADSNGSGPGSERSGPGLRKAEPSAQLSLGLNLEPQLTGASQSPAEEKLKRAFLASGVFARPRCQSDIITGSGPLGVLIQQLPITRNGSRYVLDFAVLQLPAGEFVGVEVDGFEYHDRTPEQAEHDRARDRALVASGWIVLRFAAREVMRDADGCVTEVLRFLRRATGVLRVG